MILVVMGVCGSGKTTLGERLAARLGWPFVEGDELHPAANREKMSAGRPLSDADRRPWLDRIAGTLARHHGEGGDLVVACSALKRCYRERLARSGAPITYLHLDGARALLEARMSGRRDHFMPAALLASQLETLEPPGPEEAALRLDAADPPERLVRQVRDHLRLTEKEPTR